jgi:hypothetical protein
MSLPQNPNDEFPQPDPEEVERARQKATLLDEAAMKIGLYTDNVDLMLNPADGSLVLVAQMRAGDLAWSERVQNPVQHEMVEELDDDFTETKIQEMRERARRLKDTGSLD